MKPFLRRLSARLAPLVAVALMGVSAPAHAEFMGGGYLTDYAGCDQYGWPVNVEMVRARYSAREIDGGPSQIVLNFAVGGVNTYVYYGDLSPSRAWRQASGQVIWGTTGAIRPAPRLRVLERESIPFAGASFDAHVENIRLRLRIRHFNGMRGCTVTAVLMLNDWNNEIN